MRPGLQKWGEVACAASNQMLDQACQTCRMSMRLRHEVFRKSHEAPSSYAVLTCKASMPGCLGMAVLPWRAEQAGSTRKHSEVPWV